ncbi:HNH endonuclease [Streptomyces sp. NPDC056291]|uniref:HNH endonuclease n=1 Tax=Streptomyces sp. NPDC056291 TaxID=3345772 RepID=UPI0035E18011
MSGSSAVDRILQKCEDLDGCWVYTGTPNQDGYCRVRHFGRMTMGHRILWEELRSEIPDGLTLDHLCRNRACVNPWHLDPVPQRVNAQRMVPKTHCPAGHTYTDDNIYRLTNGAKYCKTCHLARCKRRREKGESE